MECVLCCQMCCTSFPSVYGFKKHLLSLKHQEKIKDTFQEGTVKTNDFVPTIIFVDPNSRSEIDNPIVGLSLLTMCFSTMSTSLYLCHVCEQKCLVENIFSHIFSRDHYSNYFNYTNPNQLSFSWTANMDMRVALRSKIRQQMDQNGLPKLQILQLPTMLMDKLLSKTYSEAMEIMSENDRLFKVFEDMQPKRTTIQTYQNSSSRKHPLLGMQHLVECICVGPGAKRYYLCTLCRLTIGAHMIIKHVLSFDHIYCYFNAWHPSTLLSKESYKNYKSLAPMILDLAKQTEEIHGTASMKEVILQPNEFKTVDFTCYAEALKKLESITKSSLTTTIEPGNKLKYRTATAQSMSSLNQFTWRLSCQSCRKVFDRFYKYQIHLSTWEHEQMLQKYFGKAEIPCGYEKRVKSFLGLLAHVKKSLKINQPVVGTAMVVTCIPTFTEAEPIYLCFACLEAFPQSQVEEHFDSQKHLISSLLYLNPWRLPFAWEEDLDDDILRSLVVEEERKRNQDQIVLKIFDLPDSIFWRLDSSDYRQVLNNLDQHHALLKREVPPCETFSKLQENERFPLLGKQFLVAYDVYVHRELQHTRVELLCLLCERKLSNKEAEAHLFSREHVTRFLDQFHPGSLNSIGVDADTLLDLAKQAACIHRSSNMQEVKLKWPMWKTYSYSKAISILEYSKKQKRNGNLKPPIRPLKKLVPRKISGKADQNLKEDENKNSSNAKRKEGETSDDKRTLTPKEKQLETTKEASPKTFQKEIAHETSREIKGNTEKPKIEKTSKETKVSENTEKNDEAQREVEKHSGARHVPTQLSNITKPGDKKRPRNLTEQEDSCPDEDVRREMSSKRCRLLSEDAAASEKSTEMPKSLTTEQITADWKRNRREVALKVSSTLLKCQCTVTHDQVYLCGSCSLVIPERKVNGHLNRHDHPKMVQMVVNVDEKMCSTLSKQSFQSALHTLRKHKLWPDGVDEPSLTSSSSRVKPANHSASLDASVKIGSPPKRKEAPASVCSVATSQCTTSSKLAARTSCAAVAKSAHLTRPQERKSGTTSLTAKPACCNGSPSSQTKPTVVEEAAYRIVPSVKENNAFRYPETSPKDFKTSQTKMASVAVTKMPKKSAKPASGDVPKTLHTRHYENKSVEVKTDLHQRKPHAAPHLKSERCEHTKLTKETCLVSTSQKTPSTNFKVGLGYMIVVSWNQKQQIYCLLCSVKLYSSTHHHVFSFYHQYNYVKRKYPEWTAKPTELKTKLQKTVALLAEIEKRMTNSQTIQKLEVEKNIYQKLGGLPESEAVKMVKKMMKDRRSSSNVHAEASLMLEVSNPCEVSSSDDGLSVLHGATGIPANNQSKQNADQNQYQTQLTQIAEVESSSNEEVDLTAGHLIKGRHLDGEDTPGSDLIQSPFQSCSSFSRVTPDFIPASGIQAGAMRGVTVEKTRLSKHLVNPGKKSDPASQGPNKHPQNKQKFSDHQINSLNLQAATASTGQQDQSGQSHKVEEPPKQSARTGKFGVSQACTRTPVGKKVKGCSNLSFYLKESQQDTKGVIGLGSVWECRGNSLKTFFLCESCKKTLSQHDICQHMASFDHQFKYVLKEQPDLLQKFWFEEDVPHLIKMDIFFKIVVHELSKREHFYKVDAQCILLESKLHEVIRTAAFNDALKIVQSIRNEEKPAFFQSPFSSTQEKTQQPEEQHRVERSLPIERLSPQAQQTNQRRDGVAGQKRDWTSIVEALEVKGVSSRLRVNCSHEKVEFVSLVPMVGTFLTPQETNSGLYRQPEFKPALSQLPISDPDPLHIKQEPAFESASFASVDSPVSQNPEVSSRNEGPPSRKRPAETTEDPLPAKFISNPAQVKSEPSSPSVSDFPSANPAVKSGVLSKLAILLQNSKSQVNPFPFKSEPVNSHTVNQCATSSSETVEARSPFL